MKPVEFDCFVEEFLEKVKVLLRTKGRDYSSNDDRHSNFKDTAKKLNLTPMQVWSVYFTKHLDAIYKYCATGTLESEPIESRFLDTIAYLLLGFPLALEMMQTIQSQTYIPFNENE